MINNTDKKKLGQGYVNLKKMTVVELSELLERQQKIIQNKAFLKKLPDKGERILLFESQIMEELNKKKSVSHLTDLLGNMKLGGISEQIEWTGSSVVEKETTNSDDLNDDSNPLVLIANHSGTLKSYIKEDEKIDQSLVTQKDLRDIQSFQKPSYVETVCSKYDKLKPPQARFKLNEPKCREEIGSAFRSSSQNVRERLGPHWEVTAATPPVPIYGDVKPIALSESLALQKEHANKLREIRFKEAQQMLKTPNKIEIIGTNSISNIFEYRNPPNPCSVFEGTAVREVGNQNPAPEDCDIAETGGATFYNIIDDIPETN